MITNTEDFKIYLYYNFPADYRSYTRDGITENAVNAIHSRHEGKYAVWQKLSCEPWIKAFYGNILPSEVFSGQLPPEFLRERAIKLVLQNPVYLNQEVLALRMQYPVTMPNMVYSVVPFQELKRYENILAAAGYDEDNLKHALNCKEKSLIFAAKAEALGIPEKNAKTILHQAETVNLLEQLALLNQKANQAQTEAEREHALKQLDAFIAVNAEYLYKNRQQIDNVLHRLNQVSEPAPDKTASPSVMSADISSPNIAPSDKAASPSVMSADISSPNIAPSDKTATPSVMSADIPSPNIAPSDKTASPSVMSADIPSPTIVSPNNAAPDNAAPDNAAPDNVSPVSYSPHPDFSRRRPQADKNPGNSQTAATSTAATSTAAPTATTASIFPRDIGAENETTCYGINHAASAFGIYDYLNNRMDAAVATQLEKLNRNGALSAPLNAGLHTDTVTASKSASSAQLKAHIRPPHDLINWSSDYISQRAAASPAWRKEMAQAAEIIHTSGTDARSLSEFAAALSQNLHGLHIGRNRTENLTTLAPELQEIRSRINQRQNILSRLHISELENPYLSDGISGQAPQPHGNNRQTDSKPHDNNRQPGSTPYGNNRQTDSKPLGRNWQPADISYRPAPGKNR